MSRDRFTKHINPACLVRLLELISKVCSCWIYSAPLLPAHMMSFSLHHAPASSHSFRFRFNGVRFLAFLSFLTTVLCSGYHDNLTSKTTSMPNLCERLPGCGISQYGARLDSADDLAPRGTRVVSADGGVYGGRMVDPSLIGGFPAPIGRHQARRSGSGAGGGVIKPARRSGSGLLRNSKPYSPVSWGGSGGSKVLIFLVVVLFSFPYSFSRPFG